MFKKTDSLVFRFALIFLCFTIIAVLMSSINAFYNQTSDYKRQCERNMKNIAAYLKMLLKKESEEFIILQNYLVKHMNEIKVPIDFNGDYNSEKERFALMFAELYPGKVFSLDVSFDQLSFELKQVYITYVFEKWLDIFEKVRDNFDIKYAYYIVPAEEPLHMLWMIDGVREKSTIHGEAYLNICDDIYEPLEKHEKMWFAWNTGSAPDGYDVYDNEYGKTYAYYTPLVINGKRLGVIGVEVEIARVNYEILQNTLRQIAGMSAILIVCISFILYFIYRRYILKLEVLQYNVSLYSQNKNASIASNIEKSTFGRDEISTLALQISMMMMEIENYIKSIANINIALGEEKERVAAMKELATSDALTGIRNKTAYDNEIKRLNWEIDDHKAEFGLALIDLNFLKRVNDTYGHEYGNISIKKLCNVVCTIFKHSPVFRIGGDEFVVILENDDYINIDELTKKFNDVLDAISRDMTLERWERVSAAMGVAFFDQNIDHSVSSVFKRADKEMYQKKKAMKAIRLE